MHSLSEFAASYLMNALWEPVSIFLAAWLASRVLRRLGPQAEHAMWVFALFATVVTPALPILRRLPAVYAGSSSADLNSQIIFIADKTGTPAHAGIWSFPPAWFWCLLAVYLACALVFAVRLALSLRGVRNMVRQARPAALPWEHEEIWRRCQNAFSLRHAQVLVSDEAPSPIALDLRRPVLLLSPDFAHCCTPQDFLAATAHECAHLKRHDFQKNLIYEITCLALAFHPVIWLIKSRVAQSREMICDVMATEFHPDARSYSRSLLRLAAMVAVSPQPPARCAIGIFDAGVLEKRIMRINLKRQQTRTVVKYALLLSSALLLLSAAVGSAAMAPVVEPQAASGRTGGINSSEPVNRGDALGEHVYKIGHGVTAPVPIKEAKAQFPKTAPKGKKPFTATVIVRLVVDAEGMPTDVHVIHSFRPDFDAEAVKAVKEYRFKPAMRQGQPVAVSVSIEVNFKRY